MGDRDDTVSQSRATCVYWASDTYRNKENIYGNCST
jgi:hypothetical protein